MIQSLSNILKSTPYQQSLQSGEWKSFAARIRKDRGNSCECCKRGNIELNVHHIAYEEGKQPWEYAHDDVVLLCRGCHRELHDQLKQFRRFVFGKMTPQSFKILNGALSVAFDKHDPLKFAHALADFVGTPSVVDRHSKAWLEFEKAKSDIEATSDSAIRRADGQSYAATNDHHRGSQHDAKQPIHRMR